LVLAFPFVKKNNHANHIYNIINNNNTKTTLPTESMIHRESQNIKDYGKVYYEYNKSNIIIGWINDVFLGEYDNPLYKKLFYGLIIDISFDKQKLKNIMLKDKLKSLSELRFSTSYFITFDIINNEEKTLADYKFDSISITKNPMFNQCKIIKIFF